MAPLADSPHRAAVAWHRAELARLADARGVSRPVELLEHEAVPGPMTFGVMRPVIVLPLDAREWSEADVRRAMVHELEHIQRGDWLMHRGSHRAALYWFHPLVWTAWRQLSLEAERSCDDAVVVSEERTDYAEQLVTLAQRLSATRRLPCLEWQIAAISQRACRRCSTIGSGAAAPDSGSSPVPMAAAALVVVTIAPVRAVARDGRAAVVDQNQAQTRTPGSASRARSIASCTRRPRPAIRRREGNPRRRRESEREDRRRRQPADRRGAIGALRYREAAARSGADPNGVVEGDGSPLIRPRLTAASIRCRC